MIILVPEIALTPQALARFEARFGDIVAVLHSGMSDGQRHDEWLRLARGEAHVCVGPRSAVFAPLSDIGLVVIDEEHESSYKHEGDPRYDARAVAEHRAHTHGAVLIAGRATPRPESVPRHERLRRCAASTAAASRGGDPRHARPAPPAPPADAARARRPQARAGQGDRAPQPPRVVELPLVGDCGRVWMCPNCEVALVLHRASASIACHHCGHRERVPRAAPTAAPCPLQARGRTERLEHELAAPSGIRSSRDAARRGLLRGRGSRADCSSGSPPPARACSSGRRWSPRGTISPTSASASCSTPTRPALPRLPRRGADVRARHAARRTRRAGR